LVPDGDVSDRNVLELLDHLESFRLTRAAAVDRLRAINAAVSHWAQDALALGAESDETESMKPAFEGANRERVQELEVGAEPTVIDLAPGKGTRSVTGPPTGERIWIGPHYRGEKLMPGHFRTKPQRS
jgi:serine/threonine-protein kinase HipA